MSDLESLGITKSTRDKMIVGIIGFPGTGKSTSMLTFPNPVVMDFDTKLPAGVPVIPIHDAQWVRKLLNQPATARPNRRDAAKKWIRDSLPKLPADHTFCLDSWTNLQNEFDQQKEVDPSPYMTKGRGSNLPEYDGFKFYAHKISYSYEIFSLLKATPHTCIITLHEQIDRDTNGNPNGLIKPLMSGQFADQFAGQTHMFVRQVVKPFKNLDDTCKGFYQEYLKEKGVLVGNVPPEVSCFLWQIYADGIFAPILPTGMKVPCRFIPADYSVLKTLL